MGEELRVEQLHAQQIRKMDKHAKRLLQSVYERQEDASLQHPKQKKSTAFSSMMQYIYSLHTLLHTHRAEHCIIA